MYSIIERKIDIFELVMHLIVLECTFKHFFMSSIDSDSFLDFKIKRRKSSGSRLSFGTAISDSTVDEEWEELNKKLKVCGNFSDEPEDLSIDQSDHAEILKQEITEKQNECKRLEQGFEELRQRFMWDLSLAMKQCLVEELGPESENGVVLSTVRIHDIMDRSVIDDPQPLEWNSWIEDQYIQAL